MTFVVTVEETLSREVPVEAETVEEALKKAEEKYDSSEIVLDSDDYVGVKYSDSRNHTLSQLVFEADEFLWYKEFDFKCKSGKSDLSTKIQKLSKIKKEIELLTSTDGVFNLFKNALLVEIDKTIDAIRAKM